MAMNIGKFNFYYLLPNDTTSECLKYGCGEIDTVQCKYGRTDVVVSSIPRDGNILLAADSNKRFLYVDRETQFMHLSLPGYTTTFSVSHDRRQAPFYGDFIGNNSLIIAYGAMCEIVYYQVTQSGSISTYVQHTFTRVQYACLNFKNTEKKVKVEIDNVLHKAYGRYFFTDHKQQRNYLYMYAEEEAGPKTYNFFDMNCLYELIIKNDVKSVSISVSTDLQYIVILLGIVDGNKKYSYIRYISKLVRARMYTPSFYVIQPPEELFKIIGPRIQEKKSEIEQCVYMPRNFCRTNGRTAPSNGYSLSLSRHSSEKNDILVENMVDLEKTGAEGFFSYVLHSDIRLQLNPLYPKFQWLALYYKYTSIPLRQRRKVPRPRYVDSTTKVYFLIKEMFEKLPSEIVELVFSHLTKQFTPIPNDLIVKFCDAKMY